MSNAVAIVLGSIVFSATMLFNSWRSMVADNHLRDLNRQLAREKFQIDLERLDFEYKELEKDRELERQRSEHQREMIRYKRQVEEP